MADIFAKLPTEFAEKLQQMVAAGTPAKRIYDFIFSNITAEQARDVGFSRTELYNTVLANRLNPQPDPLKDQERILTATTSDAGNSAAPTDKQGTEIPPVLPVSDALQDPPPTSSDEFDGLDLEFASIGIPELQGMILKKESFKALRRMIISNARPRKAMSAAKMHLPARLARTDKMLESCVDQVYLAIAALEGGQNEIARVLLNNMAANIEVERRNAIAEALGVEDAAADISRDGRTDLFSFEERERLPSFRDKQQPRRSKPAKAKAKPNADRSFRPPADSKNGKTTGGGDRKSGRHQPTG